MTSMKLSARLAMTAAATTLAAASVLTAMPEAASAATVTRTVNGTSYDITTVTGSFNDFQSALVNTPWWNNNVLAEQFALEVGGSLGSRLDPVIFSGQFEAGPMFAYEEFELFGFELVRSTFFAPHISGVISGTGLNKDSTFVYATASVTPPTTPIPTPALLPGLVGMGIAAYRKRNLASSTDA